MFHTEIITLIFYTAENAYYDVCARVSSLRINACFKCSVYISHTHTHTHTYIYIYI